MKGLKSDYRFSDGRWIEAPAPEWFAIATAIDDSWQSSLTKAGATHVDEFGAETGGDSIEIYEGPAGDYAILFRDSAKCIARVFIDNVADYLTFRASVVAPQASLIMESERYYAWKDGKRLLRIAG